MKATELAAQLKGDGEVFLPGGGHVSGIEDAGGDNLRLVAHDYAAEQTDTTIADLECRLAALKAAKEGRTVTAITPQTGDGSIESNV